MSQGDDGGGGVGVGGVGECGLFIPREQNMPQGAKCSNTPILYTTDCVVHCYTLGISYHPMMVYWSKELWILIGLIIHWPLVLDKPWLFSLTHCTIWRKHYFPIISFRDPWGFCSLYSSCTPSNMITSSYNMNTFSTSVLSFRLFFFHIGFQSHYW